MLLSMVASSHSVRPKLDWNNSKVKGLKCQLNDIAMPSQGLKIGMFWQCQESFRPAHMCQNTLPAALGGEVV